MAEPRPDKSHDFAAGGAIDRPCPRSSIVDALSIPVSGEHLVKVHSGYDSEWGPEVTTITPAAESGGQVTCPASQQVCGEYALSGDTLFYEGLLGSAADGVVPRTASYTYLKVH